MKIYLQNSLLLDKDCFVVVTRSFVPRFALHCLVASAHGGIEGNIAHHRTRSCCRTECGKNALRNVAKMPYCCNNALNMLRKCPNFTMHIIIIIIIIIIIVIIFVNFSYHYLAEGYLEPHSNMCNGGFSRKKLRALSC